MTVTAETIANFVCRLAYAPEREGLVVTAAWFALTEEQVTMLYGARKALGIMEGLANNSVKRDGELAACREVIEQLLEQCAEGNKPKPDPQISVRREQIDALGRAATYLIEFQLRKQMEDEADKRHQANRGKYRGSR